MANRTIKVLNSVAAGAIVNTDSPAIPSGKILRFQKLVISEQNLGSNISSGILVQWGTVGAFEELAAGFVTGSTVEIAINEERTGDGVKFISITRQNNSAAAKRIIAWLSVYDE